MLDMLACPVSEFSCLSKKYLFFAVVAYFACVRKEKAASFAPRCTPRELKEITARDDCEAYFKIEFQGIYSVNTKSCDNFLSKILDF